MLFQPMLASAKCGGVDYSWGADALSNAHDFTVTMMLYVVYLVYAIAAIVGIIGALQIYIKMNTGLGMSMWNWDAKGKRLRAETVWMKYTEGLDT